MVRGNIILVSMAMFIMTSCQNDGISKKGRRLSDTTEHTRTDVDTSEITKSLPPSASIDTRDVEPEALTRFAQTLIGTPYKYGSIEPQQGFDCSGFITYVFNHFNIAVPRSSKDFEHVGTEVGISEALAGDLILFTGTDSTDRQIGHMGIIVDRKDTVKFIHSTSGKAYGVTITPLNEYYQGRYVKTVRVFK